MTKNLIRKTLLHILVWTFTGLPAAAQISPGQLSRPHAELDSNDQCLSCHSADRAVDPVNCLDCHEILAERVDAGAGLHTRDGYDDCRTCHIEHHGRGFELIYWEGSGPRSLEHAETGYALEGRHDELLCRDCHRAELVLDKQRFLAAGKDLDRTYLGLGTACLDCHDDTHRGQLTATCTECHSQDAWTPAPLFDHQQTSYPLTGKHRAAACADCHPAVADAGGTFARYTDIEASSCTACHEDRHDGRLGKRCESCHTTSSWRLQTAPEPFDHDRTRFPLVGLHQDVECVECHPGRWTDPIPEFERCATCHEDVHMGQLGHRADGGTCDSCHSVEKSFRPSLYTVEDHRTSRFPLVESHLAVPCLSCHQPLSSPPLNPPEGTRSAEITSPRLVFPRTFCVDCHGDPHEGALDRYHTEDNGCLTCHDLSWWRSIRFDHDRADFHLLGRHRDVDCVDCHPRTGEGAMRLSDVGTACADCHDDPHAGQLHRDGVAACDSCHTNDDWYPTRFDHNLDATFSLLGAHRFVPCEECHRREADIVRFKPLAHECVDCHGGS